jgi:hypothetical protein
MFDIAGERTGGGNPTWLSTRSPATTTASAVARLLAAGADIIGKTVCDEFFFSIAGVNIHYGTPVNARAPGRLSFGHPPYHLTPWPPPSPITPSPTPSSVPPAISITARLR